MFMTEETRNLFTEMQMRIRLENIKTSDIKGFLLNVTTNKQASDLHELVDMLERKPFCIKSQEQKDEIFKFLKQTIDKLGNSTMNTAYDL